MANKNDGEQELLVKIDLSQGADDAGNGAFCAVKMGEDGLQNSQLIQFLAAKLGPMAGDIGYYIKDGCGFGVIVDGDTVSIIGIAARSNGEEEKHG